MKFLHFKTLLMAVGMLVGGVISAWAQEAGTYYIQNVGTGKWLGPANSWETQASVLNHADYWKLAKISDGVYTLESVVSNGGTNYYLTGTYCDGGATNLTFTAVDGAANTYTISNGTTYLTTDGTFVTIDGADPDDENAQWKLYSESDMAAVLATATGSSPKDATYLIKDHNLSRNNRDYSSVWNNTGATASQVNNKDLEGNAVDYKGDVRYSIEAYHKTFDVNQTLSGIPNGIYSIQVNGFYRQDGSNANLPYLYADESKTTIPEGTGSENLMQTAATAFSNGDYLSSKATAYVSDGSLKVGVATSGNSCWSIFKNFHLTYYGNPTAANPVDMTDWIQNPDVEKDGAVAFSGTVTGWQYTTGAANHGTLSTSAGELNNTSGAFTNSYAFENWKNSGDGGLNGKIYQVLTSIPNGVYKVQLAAMVRTVSSQFVYASSNGQTFKTTLSGDNEAANDYSVYAIVTDGTLEFGLDINKTGIDWAAIDNARLYYYGNGADAYAFAFKTVTVPASYSLNTSDAICPFEGGAMKHGTGIDAFQVENTTATTWFDGNLGVEGKQPYVLADNEKVNISFTAYHGWCSNSKTSSVSVFLPNGEELVGYTYNINSCNVTDVRIGGETVAGFSAFTGQSKFNDSKGANGWTGKSQYFVSTAGYNPQVMISVDGAGQVLFHFVLSSKGIDKTFKGTIDTGGKSIELEKIVITDNCDVTDRSVGISDLSITSEMATIVSLPTSKYTFDDSTNPFDGGSVVNGTVVGKILCVNDETATAIFGSKSGKGMNYVLGPQETVTIEFDAYNGYLANSKTSTFSVLNSDGNVLVGYTYDAKSGNITDVKLGGNSLTAKDGYEVFNGRSRYGTNGSGDPLNANRYDGDNNSTDKPYQLTEGYNPHVTMTISGSGKVTFRFVCAGYDINKSFEKILDDMTMDLASLKIVDSGYGSNGNRASCFDNLIITTETERVAAPTIVSASGNSYFSDSETISLATASEGASIYYTLDGTVPSASSTLYSEPFEVSNTVTVKAIVLKDGYEDSEVITATFAKLYELADVTGAETWDWSAVTEDYPTLNETTIPTNSQEFVLKNAEVYNSYSIPNAFGDAQKLSVVAQIPFKSDNKCFQGHSVKFNTTVPGMVSVTFSQTGSKDNTDEYRRYLFVNGNNTGVYSYSSSVAAKTATAFVPVGEVVVNAYNSDFETPVAVMTRIYKITFTPTKLNGSGYSTFSSNHDVQVTGADAYTATLDYEAGTITCTKIADGKIPAGTGVLLYSETANAPVTFTNIAEAPAVGANNLKATTLADGSLATMGSNTYYVLSGNTFMEYNGSEFAAGKAYFEVADGAALARSFRIVFDDDEVTAIKELQQTGVQGVRKYMENGRLRIESAKGVFTAEGTRVK